jgi:hypothetical protein
MVGRGKRRNLKERYHVQDLGADEGIILKFILKK